MTLRELFREFVVAKRVADRTRRAELSYVWLSVALTRQKTLPEFERFVASRRATQSPHEQRRALQMISARFRVPFRKTKLIRVELHG